MSVRAFILKKDKACRGILRGRVFRISIFVMEQNRQNGHRSEDKDHDIGESSMQNMNALEANDFLKNYMYEFPSCLVLLALGDREKEL